METPPSVSRPVTEDLREISPVLGVGNVTSKERRGSGELELDTGCATLGPGHVTLTSRQSVEFDPDVPWPLPMTAILSLLALLK
jgi:hypothetical protein